MRIKKAATALAVAFTLSSTSFAFSAESAADFYKGKTVDLYVGFSSGGGYDTYARVLARHMEQHIPGKPSIVVKNMPGAGSLVLANWLYNVAPKDGTAFGIVARGAAFDPLLGNDKAEFDAAKFNWIGSMNDEVSVCVAWHATGVRTLDDVMKKTLTVGGTGPSADTDQFPKILNGALGTKFDIVAGYPGGNEVNLAMERGEVQGRCGWSWSSVIATHKNWVDDKKINILLQMSTSKHPDLPNVPHVMDYAKTKEQRQILNLAFARQAMGRPFVAPPGIPGDRVAALREAFMAALKDKQFLAEAQKMQLEINPVSGQKVQELVAEIYETPKPVAEKVAAMLGRQD